LKTVAIIVNYRSAGLAKRAVQSVLDSESMGPLQVVVVDNSEDEDEAGRLRLNLPPSVTVLTNPENQGFGRACNKAFDRFPGELVLLINPDARLLPGCLLRLQQTLVLAEKIAAVSSQIFWDEELTYLLPPSSPPLLFFLQPFFDAQGIQSRTCRLLSAVWRWHSIKVWRTERPIEVRNLSGGLVLLKRESLEKAGGLFDPRFFLYFEDTDLFFRLRKSGYSLIVEPRAKAIHHYDQCGRQEWQKKRFFMRESFRVFHQKHFNGWGLRVMKSLGRLRVSRKEDKEKRRFMHLNSPFELEVPERLRGEWVFEWSPNPNFIPSVGRFGNGPIVDFKEECWTRLGPGQYFGRLGNRSSFGGYSQMVSWTVEGEERSNGGRGL